MPKAAETRGRFEKTGSFFATKDGIAYGWAIVCTENGEPYWDLQNDHIPEDEMVAAAVDFMKNSRVGSDQHTGEHTGDIVFAFPVTKNASTLGIPTEKKTGLLIGYQPHDQAQLEKIGAGERTGFSIGGLLLEYDVSDIGKQLVAIARIGKGQPDPGDVYTPSEVGSKGGKKKGKVYRRFKIDEISLVTKPAQEGATVGYVKGAVIAKAVRKQAVFTSEDDGHQHMIDFDDIGEDGCGCTSIAQMNEKDYGHYHCFAVDAATGKVTIAANMGHGHTAEMPDPTSVTEAGPPKAETVRLAAPANKGRAENSTSKIPAASVQLKSEPKPTESTMTEAEIKALQERAERAEKMATLSDAHRAYASRLPLAEQDAFVAKGLTDRDAIVKAAVEYTAADGTVYYKHDDQRVVKMAKDNDELKKSLVVAEGVAKAARISKLAAELVPLYPEDQATHEAVVSAVEEIKDEKVREAARKMLGAGNAAIGKLANPRGVNPRDGKPTDGNQTELAKAETELKTAVETFGKANNITSFEVAFALATGSDEPTRKAFEKVRELRGTAQADN